MVLWSLIVRTEQWMAGKDSIWWKLCTMGNLLNDLRVTKDLRRGWIATDRSLLPTNLLANHFKCDELLQRGSVNGQWKLLGRNKWHHFWQKTRFPFESPSIPNSTESRQCLRKRRSRKIFQPFYGCTEIGPNFNALRCRRFPCEKPTSKESVLSCSGSQRRA